MHAYRAVYGYSSASYSTGLESLFFIISTDTCKSMGMQSILYYHVSTVLYIRITCSCTVLVRIYVEFTALLLYKLLQHIEVLHGHVDLSENLTDPVAIIN